MHILIIRPGAIGDALLALPIIRALRVRYSNAHITFVSNPTVLPLAKAFGIVEEVSDYGDAQWSEIFSTAGIQSPTMRKQMQYTDLVICWLRDPDCVVQRNLLAAGVKRVIIAPGRPPEGRSIHVVEYLAETVGIELGLKINEIEQFILKEDTSTSLSLYKQPVAIHPGSGGAHKCWPSASFATVIKYLWEQKHSVLLLAGPADAERLEDVLNDLTPLPSPVAPSSAMLKVLSSVPLLEVARYLLQCRCYLGNDSGITHLSALLGVPTIALFGPSDPVTWQPLGSSVEVLREPDVDLVIKSLERSLKRR